MPHPRHPSSDATDRLIALLLLGAVVLVFWRTMDNGFIVFDDPVYITHNPVVQAGLTWIGLKYAIVATNCSNWHPLTWLSHMLDVELYGQNAAGHHFTSVLLHAANALLLFLFLRRATDRRWESAMVAALFALHPLRVESVAWASERKDVLSGFFWMLTSLAYLRYARAREEQRQSLRWYAATLALFALGLMAKPMLVTLPMVFLLLDYWPLQRIPATQHRVAGLPLPPPGLVLEKLPLLALAAASSVITFVAQEAGRAMASLQAIPLSHRLANSAESYILYIGKMIWPTRLSIIYPYPEGASLWAACLSAALLAAITVWAVRGYPRRPWAFTGWFWYLGTLIPVIGLVQVGMQSMADRYTYLPGIGLAIVAVWGGKALLRRLRAGRLATAAICAIILVLLSVQTHIQLGYWRNSVTLFSHSVQLDPDNYIAHYILAQALSKEGDTRGYQQHYDQALALNPGYVATQHNRMGYILYSQGKFQKARDEFNNALGINANYVAAMLNLGTILARQGDFEQGLRLIDKSLALDPDNAMALENKRLIERDMHDPSRRDHPGKAPGLSLSPPSSSK